MGMIQRGSTPMHTFKVDIDLRSARQETFVHTDNAVTEGEINE